jgi:ABC-type multidrug transport system ATPase subunit
MHDEHNMMMMMMMMVVMTMTMTMMLATTMRIMMMVMIIWQFYRTLCFVVPDLKAALSATGLVILFLLLFSGFITAPSLVPKYWVWCIYSNPFYYLFQGLSTTEFLSSRYTKDVGIKNLVLRGLRTEPLWSWGSILMEVGILLVYFGVCVAAMVFVEHQPQQNFTDDKAEEEVPAGAVGIEMTRMHEGGEAKEAISGDEPSSLSFTPMTLAFRGLGYSVRGAKGEQIDLLHDVDGYFKPGTMTALMGSSGAGKTTLMDCLAGRKTKGMVRGERYINGAAIDMAVYPRMIGYVEQMDLHSPFTTVREALEFSGRLRLSADIPRAEQDRFIKDMMQLLELDSIAGDMVGPKGEGLSTEQRKRLTIGVELVSNPSLVFLDEPTSGLDSRAAQVVIRVVKRLAMTGRTVICTVHQPSSAIFFQFDSLLLLRKVVKRCTLVRWGSAVATWWRTFSRFPARRASSPARIPPHGC